MDIKEIREWESAVDAVEFSPLTVNLPVNDAMGSVVGTEFVDGNRKWLRCKVVAGNTGGRWAYWHSDSVKAGGGKYNVIADKIFNGDAHHFVGMLAVPYTKQVGVDCLMWVLVEPRTFAPAREWVREEPLKSRYEKSKEVYDVNTGETKILP